MSAAVCPPTNALSVLRLSTTSDSFRDELERVITKIHDTKTVKYNIQHYCTAVANRRYLIDKINVGACCWLFSKQLANVRLFKCLYLFNIKLHDVRFMNFCKHLELRYTI